MGAPNVDRNNFPHDNFPLACLADLMWKQSLTGCVASS
ncbi:hypothetical protein NBRC3257_0012 [Gluconobacter thailandicus NBRC 3257]|uniref:Transposase n=1 Tax=Gluconobacter thailandicus NBRC 3257 TaxID=1381097 RepID=A0ABQ0IS18_GLUTH|nr:hypothetical protein B932_2549 [Gluconobacter oxydans H24]GAC86824.1 hypothetical protein NBRC3255_0485 [Gluconobacter thailandicus NBRC 3255]GAD25013.1 hypothetical protein NBRC3257_0012 [Gluconobacter thailandicus NBRC 3257]